MGIGQAYGHHDVTDLYVQFGPKGLLDPELFQLDFSALFGLLFPLAPFFGFLLIGCARASVFELDLAAHLPSLAEIVREVNHGVGNVEPPMVLTVALHMARLILIYIVAVKIAGIGYLRIAPYLEARPGRAGFFGLGLGAGLNSAETGEEHGAA